ncbi:sulfatase-like hydrolase/transferase [Rubritalea marina]|uniref:sulfatase-like hydrolase/transferase n=1 Tax=Rubritalea marina TaxID=361055 RepID=UPI00037E71B8|nr:sulfatase-like hydrolase/transferase [Rubritalea marina]
MAGLALAEAPRDGSVLPFPPEAMAGVTEERLQDSTMKWPKFPERLPEDAPNIVFIMLDDVGYGLSEVFGGEIKTPAFAKLAEEGIIYNAFHTTSICSPTRAATLTGRNHTRVGSGTIAERAVAFDGYTGIIPKSSATIPEILKHYGYHTAAFGKWHNTPAVEATSIGPKDRWPIGYGFERFYGFLGGETSQWEPRLTDDSIFVEPPEHDPTYHFSVDMKDKALQWVDDRQAFAPDKPFFIWFTPGGAHGPHHVFPEWADKYKGKFDDGWDAYRKRVHQRQLELGIIPEGTQLTERDETLVGWDSIPEEQKVFQTRLMEVFAGYVEHTDYQVGELLNGLEQRGLKENTLVFYLFGDNGSSAEGQNGSISELLAQNNIPNTVEQQMAALESIGGIEVLGGPKTDNMYHAGWAWAGSTPFKGTKLLGSYFGGTRNPMVVSWPAKIKADGVVRQQFTHCVDIAPTIYDILEIKHPEEVNGLQQDPMDGVSFASSFATADADTGKSVQFFDNNGSRAIYKDGWMACTFGPFIPWNTPASVSRVENWDSATDEWELYNLNEDFSQANNLAKKHPKKLEQLKAEFTALAKDNKDFPIGAGNWLRLHPADRVKTDYTEWDFTQNTRRMPEFAAPGIGRESNQVSMEIEVSDEASGVLYAVGGAGGGLALYMDQGHLVYEYNMFIIERYIQKSSEPLKAGEYTITIDTEITAPGKSGEVSVKVDGKEVLNVALKQSVPVAFTATESFDVGIDLGSPISVHYAERRPFAFNGKIKRMHVALTPIHK